MRTIIRKARVCGALVLIAAAYQCTPLAAQQAWALPQPQQQQEAT